MCVIGESHVKFKHKDGSMAIEGYNIYRRDCIDGRSKAGVTIYLITASCRAVTD